LKKYNRSIFIEKASIVHNNVYDYSKVEYVNSKTKVIIICKTHGEFLVTPNNHINNKVKCPECIKVLQSNWSKGKGSIIKSQLELLHPSLDFKDFIYRGILEKSRVTCLKCGKTFLSSVSILRKVKHSCKYCDVDKIFDTETFIEKSKRIYKDKYDYYNTIYCNSNKSISIICKKHGEFFIKPSHHLNKKGIEGCQQCRAESIGDRFRSPHEDVILKLSNIFENRLYFYPFVFINKKMLIKVRCLRCGQIFSKQIQTFLKGFGCSLCDSNQITNLDSFIIRSKEINNDLFDYSFINSYGKNNEKIKLKCNTCGRIFNTYPFHHIYTESGCPHCHRSLNEKKIQIWLDKNNINYVPEYRFKDCKHIKTLPFDFAIFKEGNLLCLIEYDGETHYYPYTNTEKGLEAFNTIKIRDNIKTMYCKVHNIPLLRISYKDKKLVISILEHFLKKIGI